MRSGQAESRTPSAPHPATTARRPRRSTRPRAGTGRWFWPGRPRPPTAARPSPATPRRQSPAAPPAPSSTLQCSILRAHKRRQLHVHRHRDQRGRRGPGLQPAQRHASDCPGAPTLTTANAGPARVDLTWTAAANSSCAGHELHRHGEPRRRQPGFLSGLTNGTTYTVTVSAANAVGSGPSSNPLTATPTPTATAPGAPTLTTATRGASSCSAGRPRPLLDGSAITGYTATASPGGASCTTSTLGCTISGLANRHQLHVHGLRDQRGRHRRRVQPAQRHSGGAQPDPVATAGNATVTLTWTVPGLQRRLAGHELHRHGEPRRRPAPPVPWRSAARSTG